MKFFRSRSLACSFCGRDESKVAKLVAGPRVFICDSCVAIAKDIMDRSDDPRPRQARRGLMRRIIDRLPGAHRGHSLLESEA
jgi:ATP-dependent protease Clp ATPase subunit